MEDSPISTFSTIIMDRAHDTSALNKFGLLYPGNQCASRGIRFFPPIEIHSLWCALKFTNTLPSKKKCREVAGAKSRYSRHWNHAFLSTRNPLSPICAILKQTTVVLHRIHHASTADTEWTSYAITWEQSSIVGARTVPPHFHRSSMAS